ncbi:uncharacterized protein BN759_01960 [Bacteroides sp. CAG:702]|nr:uncharacterized protein BN759_01960 [Bacteroides sp. CAG:702]
MELLNHPLTINEVLVRTHLMTSISEVGDKDFTPISYGSGFFVYDKGRSIFVTADHTLHLDDYNSDQGRVWRDYQILIFNNIDGSDISTIQTPVGGFYFMENLDLRELNDEVYKGKPIDIAACVLNEKSCKYKFMTQKFKDEEGNIFQWPILAFGRESFGKPEKDKKCLVFGQVHTQVKGIQLRYDNVTYELDYISSHGDFHLFHTQDIVRYEDWGGLSGTPIIDEEGKCVAVLTNVLEGTNSVWGISIKRLETLLDIINFEKNREC